VCVWACQRGAWCDPPLEAFLTGGVVLALPQDARPKHSRRGPVTRARPSSLPGGIGQRLTASARDGEKSPQSREASAYFGGGWRDPTDHPLRHVVLSCLRRGCVSRDVRTHSDDACRTLSARCYPDCALPSEGPQRPSNRLSVHACDGADLRRADDDRNRYTAAKIAQCSEHDRVSWSVPSDIIS
jgi:hypothetical protein